MFLAYQEQLGNQSIAKTSKQDGASDETITRMDGTSKKLGFDKVSNSPIS